MLQIVILLAVAGLVYVRFGWLAAAGVVAGYIGFVVITGAKKKEAMLKQTNSLVGRKLSEDEKGHYTLVDEHQNRMDAHRAQFDPELRKSRSGKS
jgi:cell division protein FtsN